MKFFIIVLIFLVPNILVFSEDTKKIEIVTKEAFNKLTKKIDEIEKKIKQDSDKWKKQLEKEIKKVKIEKQTLENLVKKQKQTILILQQENFLLKQKMQNSLERTAKQLRAILDKDGNISVPILFLRDNHGVRWWIRSNSNGSECVIGNSPNWQDNNIKWRVTK